MAPRKQAGNRTIIQLKVTLKDIRPPIWRRIQVSDATTLGQLHEILQTVMGWENYHLHQFSIGGNDYGVPDPDYGFDDMLDENTIQLSQVISREKFKFFYTYDFGDGWEHEILVEKILPIDPERSYPLCLKGRRACPPEDCGGPWGYANLLDALRAPEHPEHEDMMEWVGERLDSDTFDVDEANRYLATQVRSVENS